MGRPWRARMGVHGELPLAGTVRRHDGGGAGADRVLGCAEQARYGAIGAYCAATPARLAHSSCTSTLVACPGVQRRIDSIEREYPATLGACLGDAKYDALLESVRRHGIREAITLDTSGMVLDGHHRLAVAVALGMDSVPVRIWTGSDYIERMG